MSFNISNFKANIEDQGYLKTNQFKLLVLPPPILRGSTINTLGTPTYVSDITDSLSFRIDAVRAPSIAILNYDNYHYGIGPTSKFPVSAAFNEMFISIISDGYGDIWQLWHNWLKNVYDFTSTDSASSGQASAGPTYTARYRSEYATTMQLVIYDNYGNAIQRINIYNAFPTSISDINLSWGDINTLMRLNISISYQEYTMVGSTTDNGSYSPSRVSSVSQSMFINP